MNRKQIISGFFVAFLAFILYNMLWILSPFFHPIFWAAILAFGFDPLYRRLLGFCGNRGGLAAAAATLLIFFTFVPLVVFVVLNLAREAAHLYQWLETAVENGAIEKVVDRLRHGSIVKNIEDSQWVHWEFVSRNCKQWLLKSAGNIGNFTLKQAAMFTKNILTSAINFPITFFLLFFFFRDGRKIYGYVYEITPLDDDHKKEIFRQLGDTFSAALRGQLLTGLAQGTILGLVFWALKLPLPIFFAVVTFLASLIPVFGAATVWTPFVVYLALTQDYPRAIALLLLGTFVISFVDNLLKPLLIGEKTKLPYFLLFLGILGGIQVYGFMGIFLAPAVLSLFFVLIRIYRKTYFDEPV